MSGCSLLPSRIKSKLATVVAPKDAGKPATLDSGETVATLPVPAGSTLTVTKFEAVAPAVATPSTPAVEAQPAKEVTEVKLSGPTEYRKTTQEIHANTGTVDQSIAAKRLNAAESRPLLYAAIGSLIACGFFIWRVYPTPAMICGAAAGVFLIAWKVTDAPTWLWVVGAVGIGGATFLYLGHERGLNTPK